MRKNLLFAGAMLLAMSTITPASAQVAANYNWGGVHMMANQAVCANLRLDKAASPFTLQVLFTLEDKKGAILYQKYANITNGQTVQWCFSWNTGVGGGGGGFSHFLDPDYTINVNPDVHTVVPQLRVNLPSPAPYVDMLTPTLEVIDFLPTFNVTSFANNPHLTLLPIRE